MKARPKPKRAEPRRVGPEPAEHRWLGKSVPRLEDQKLLTVPLFSKLPQDIG